MTPPPADDLSTLARGGRTNVVGFFMRLIARIPFLFIGAQWYGAEAMGRLAFVVAVLEFSAQGTTLGLKKGLALHLSGDGKDNGAWDAILVVFAVTLIPVAIFMAFPHIMFPNSAPKPLDYLLPLTIPAFALTEIMLAACAYRFNIKAAVVAKMIVEPWTISIMAIALWWFLPADGLLAAYALSIGAAVTAAAVPFLRTYGLPHNWTPRASELYALARRNAPLAGAEIIEWSSRRIDVVILGLFVSPAIVGIYYTAQQVATLPQKLKTSFDPVLGPVITKRLAENDRAAIAKQVSQAGFWILAAQSSVALALILASENLMRLIGPGREFVIGTGAMIALLAAEAMASPSVASEAALVYVARYKNFLVSLATITLQVALSFASLTTLRALGYSEAIQAIGPAASLAVSLAFSSVIKSRLAAHELRAPVRIWRWWIAAAALAALPFGVAAWPLPFGADIGVGLIGVLVAFWFIIWRYGFGEEDRVLFRKASPVPSP